MSKMMIDVEIKEKGKDAILVFDEKKNKFVTISVRTLFKNYFDEIDAKLNELEVMTQVTSEQFKHEIGRFRGLVDELGKVLGGKK